jgi:hypothetical protein
MGWRAFIAGLVLFLLVSFGASSAFSDIVYLSCSGTMANLVKRSHEKVGPIPMAVDAEKGIVSLGGYSPFPILKDGRQNFISFAGGSVDELGLITGTQGAHLYIHGGLDRVTGGTILGLRDTHPDGPPTFLVELICKPWDN